MAPRPSCVTRSLVPLVLLLTMGLAFLLPAKPAAAEDLAVLALPDAPRPADAVLMLRAETRTHGRLNAVLANHETSSWNRRNSEQTLTALLGVPMADDVLLTAELPYHWLQQEGADAFSNLSEYLGPLPNSHVSGNGDLTLAARVTVRRWREEGEGRMHLVVGTTIPTGRSDTTPVVADLSRDYHVAMDVLHDHGDNWLVHTRLAYHINGTTPEGINLSNEHQITLGIGYKVHQGSVTFRHDFHFLDRDASLDPFNHVIPGSEAYWLWTSHSVDISMGENLSLRPELRVGLSSFRDSDQRNVFNDVGRYSNEPLSFSLNMTWWVPTGDSSQS